MNREQKFEVFNKIIEIGFVESEGDDYRLVNIIVDDNKQVRELLYSLGFDDEEINMYRDEEPFIDIGGLAAESLDYYYFTGNSFVEEEEREKWEAINLLIELGLTPEQYKYAYEKSQEGNK